MDAMTNETLITALQKKSAYDHPVDNISLRETHISWVFLTGHYAYKIKKPVDFGFLDFSSLDKRKHYCEEEVRLNGRLAPQLYLGVVPVCGNSTPPRINGPGPVIEYAVKMRQFDTTQEFDELLARGELSKEQIDKTSQVIANFHSNAAITDATSTFGTPEAVLQPIEENFDQINQLGEKWLIQHQLNEPLESLHQWVADRFKALKEIIQQRKENGFVRECHGDLHLRNIVLIDDQVTPFDGIEFNSNLRWIDVLSELAFLLMDIDDHDRPDLSRRLLNNYLQRTGDYEGLAVLRFYQMYRAMVRAKVAGLQLLQSTDENETLTHEIENYMRLALQYTQPVSPRIVITHGLSGSGKTYVSQLLLEQCDIIRLRSDVERKRLFGLDETTSAESDLNKGIYSKEATVNTYKHLLRLTGIILNSGFSVMIDAAFLKQDQRQLFYQFAENNGFPFIILHCESDLETQRQRLVERQQHRKDASDANETILGQQINHQEPLSSIEKGSTITVDTTQEPDISEVLDWLNQ